MTEMLPEHDHCQVCDDPVELGQKFCSQKCEDDHQRDTKREKLKNYLFLAAAVVVVIVLTVSFFVI